MTIRVRMALPILAAFFVFGLVGNSHAAPKGGGGGNADPEILVVQPYYDDAQLTIFGNNLSDGQTPPTVTLNGNPLMVAWFDDIQIDLYVDVELYLAGDYKLVVDSNMQKTRPTEMMLTLGAVGPEGPSGPQGPQGTQGPVGPTPSSYEVWSGWIDIPSSASNYIIRVECYPGDFAVGGGVRKSADYIEINGMGNYFWWYTADIRTLTDPSVVGARVVCLDFTEPLQPHESSILATCEIVSRTATCSPPTD